MKRGGNSEPSWKAVACACFSGRRKRQRQRGKEWKVTTNEGAKRKEEEKVQKMDEACRKGMSGGEDQET